MILVLNCGSQSFKWKLFDLPAQAGKKSKLIEQNKLYVLESDKYEETIRGEISKLKDKNIKLVGHRVVHGKDIFKQPIEITKQNIGQLEELSNLAPLHNYFNVLGIKICQEIFNSTESGQKIPQIAVFDTEFFKDLPEIAYTYALPKEIVKKFGYRRYGFHGISHEYVAKKIKKKKIISIHLGGGASICAIKNGKAVDISMGFTPMEGLVMMTRAGNIDAGIILELVKNFGAERADKILNKESGIKGICGAGEFLKVLDKIKENDESAKLAFDVFVYSIKKYIGSYFAVLGGCDALVFTGSIGAGNPKTRNAICKNLDILKNAKILVIETDEELAIAQKIKPFLKDI